jgi:hypothetical protein
MAPVLCRGLSGSSNQMAPEDKTVNPTPNDKCGKLRKFVLEHLDMLEPSGGGGTAPTLPTFDLYAQDYLAFAESEMTAFVSLNGGHKHLINCVAHLKRAVDCQLDAFLHVFGLYKFFRDRNLKFEKKLDFLGSAGVFSSRSLKKLNSIRNQMEHRFAVPELGEIEVYYDLVVAFVAVLQRTIASSFYSEQDFGIVDPSGEESGVFSIEYESDRPLIRASWELREEKQEIESNMENHPDEFAFFFRVWILLGLLETFGSTRYVALQLTA